MQSKFRYLFLLSLLVLLIAGVLTLFVGVYTFDQSLLTSVKYLLFDREKMSDADAYVLLDLRIPRMLFAVLIGSALAVCGTIMQGLFKNPLATPDLIGITAGASLMAACTIVLGSSFRAYLPDYIQYSLLSIAAFAGALFTTYVVYRMATKSGKTNISLLLLTGVAFTALGFSFTGFLVYLAKDDELRDLTFWNLGSLGGANWTKVLGLLGVLLLTYPFLLFKGKVLNAFWLGEKDAAHLGIRVERIKKGMLLMTSLLVGVCVSFAGTIGFVGLIVPYILRLLFHSDYRFILPLSAVWGALLLLLADTLSRVLVAPSELPIGIVTGIMGAPIFMAILIKNRKMF